MLDSRCHESPTGLTPAKNHPKVYLHSTVVDSQTKNFSNQIHCIEPNTDLKKVKGTHIALLALGLPLQIHVMHVL